MSEEKPVVVQAHGDGFPGQRIISELKTFTNSVEENLESNDSFSSGKSNATSLKMLLEKEMSQEVGLKRRSSIVARLMGLEDDLHTTEEIIHHARSDTHLDSKEVNKAQGKEHHQSIRLMTQDLQHCHEYKDVYEVCEDESGTSSFQDRTSEKLWSSENKSEQSDIMEDKFMKPKCFAMEEKLPHTKELQEGLKAPSSDIHLLLERAEECDTSLSRYPSRFHTNGALSRTKRITVLKPVSSAEISGVRSQTKRVNKEYGLKMGQLHQSASSKEETLSRPSRIIVLRPTPGKPSISKAKLTPRTSSFELVTCNNLNDLAYNEANISSSGLVHGVKQHWHDGCHQRDNPLLSFAHPSGYVGDESSCGDSEDNSSGSEIDEAGGSSDSEQSSPWKHSCNYIRGNEGPYSGSFHDIPESSITREAKKQLSERWATVTCYDVCLEKLQPSRRTYTLGEMLSIQEAKKVVPNDQSCGIEKEPPAQSTFIATSRKDSENVATGKFSIENFVPVSMLDNMPAKVISNPEIYRPKLVVISGKGKLSFKGRVSDFFLPKSKNLVRQKSIHYPSDYCAEKVVQSQLDHNLNRNVNKIAVHFGDRHVCSSVQVSTGTSERTVSFGATVPLDPPSGNLDKLEVNKGLTSNPDQPSPTSVLDVPSEDSSCNEPETSGRTSKNAISRPSAVGSVACSLSWDNTSSDSQLLRTRRPTSLISDADTDESESHVLVQNIMSSPRLGDAQSSMTFTGWHLPDYPLDPVLCSKILELREQSSYRRLLFDCVDAALVEIGENTLLSAFPCSKTLSRTLRVRDSSTPDLRVEVWSVLKDWIYGARMFVVSKKGNAGVMLDRIVKQEVGGRAWMKALLAQVVDITEELGGGVMEELVEETVLDFSSCFKL